MGPPPFSWTSASIHLEVIVAAGLVGGAYLGAWATRAVRTRGSSGPGDAPGRPGTGLGAALLFFGGLLALIAALNGPLHDLSDHYLFSAHMVQHLVLTLVVPPLVLAGTPAWMADGLLRGISRWRPAGMLIRVLLRPLPALACYAVALIAWHLPGPYNRALEVHGWHIVEHLVLIASAVLGWWPILSPAATVAPPLPYGAQLLYLFVFGIPMTVVAAFVTGAEHVLYPFYAAAPRIFDITPLTDQRLGGVIMWVPAAVMPVLVFSLVFFRWVAAEAEADA
jgi:putative membrane protein